MSLPSQNGQNPEEVKTYRVSFTSDYLNKSLAGYDIKPQFESDPKGNYLITEKYGEYSLSPVTNKRFNSFSRQLLDGAFNTEGENSVNYQVTQLAKVKMESDGQWLLAEKGGIVFGTPQELNGQKTPDLNAAKTQELSDNPQKFVDWIKSRTEDEDVVIRSRQHLIYGETARGDFRNELNHNHVEQLLDGLSHSATGEIPLTAKGNPKVADYEIQVGGETWFRQEADAQTVTVNQGLINVEFPKREREFTYADAFSDEWAPNAEDVPEVTRTALAQLQDWGLNAPLFVHDAEAKTLTIQDINGNVSTFSGVSEAQFEELQSKNLPEIESLLKANTDEQAPFVALGADLRLLPASVAQQHSVAPPPLEEPLAVKLSGMQRELVQETQQWVDKVTENVSKGIEQGKNWFNAFRDSWRSPEVQEQLQGFKDTLSEKTVRFGNWIASRPDALATHQLMKTLNEKFKEGQEATLDQEFKLGEYQLKTLGKNTLTFGSEDSQKLVFKVNKTWWGQEQLQLVTKAADLNAAELLKEIRSLSPQATERQQAARQELIDNIERRLDGLEVGTRVNGWTVRRDGEEKFLDNWQGRELSGATLSQLGYQQLSAWSGQLERAFHQQQCQQCAPILGRMLKAQNSYEYQEGGCSLSYDPARRELTFQNKDEEQLVARALGKGQWAHVEGELSPKTADGIRVNLAERVAAWEKQQRLEAQKAQNLAAIA